MIPNDYSGRLINRPYTWISLSNSEMECSNWYTINNTKCPCRRRLTEVMLRQTARKRDARLMRAMQSWMHVAFPAARTMRYLRTPL